MFRLFLVTRRDSLHVLSVQSMLACASQYNNTFVGSEGHPMIYWGRRALSVHIENNLFEWIDWVCDQDCNS